MALGAVLWCVNQICPSGPAVIHPGWLGFGISNSSKAMAGAGGDGAALGTLGAGAGGGGAALRALEPAAALEAVSLTLRQPGIRQVESANDPSTSSASALDGNFT
jgi:hypothetical protein